MITCVFIADDIRLRISSHVFSAKH